jgi:vancomycin resistance protein YoaR
MHSREGKTKAYQPAPRAKVARHVRTEEYTEARTVEPASRPAVSGAHTVSPAARTVAPAAGPDDDFVFVGEDGAVDIPGRKDRQPKKKSKKPLIVALIIIAVILLAGAGGFTWWYLSSGSADSYVSNITVSGVSIGGMNPDEAKAALAPVEAKLADGVKVDVSLGDKKLTLTKADLKYSFNTDEVLAQAKAYSEEKGIKSGEQAYEIKMKIDESSLADASKKVAEAFDTKAADASVASFEPDKSDMFTYKDEVLGKKVKTDDLTGQLRELFASGNYSGAVIAPAEDVKPAVTVDYLKQNIRKLSSFTTYSTNGYNGNSNMRTAFASCTGSIIEPGATWSFNNCTGDSNLESNGYLPAGVIIEGRHETGIGGGICQSSTTIYNAGLLCGMEVVERYCHYYQSSYVDAGRDATIDYGNLDLKLKNPFKYQLFLKCYMEDATLYAEFYGLPSDEFDDVQISTSSPSYFSNGYKVAASRTFYKNGAAVRTDELPSSTYYTSAPSSTSSKKTSTSSKPASTSSQAASAADDPVSTDPIDDPIDDPGEDPGDDPGADPGEDPGTDPGDDPGTNPGEDEGGEGE